MVISLFNRDLNENLNFKRNNVSHHKMINETMEEFIIVGLFQVCVFCIIIGSNRLFSAWLRNGLLQGDIIVFGLHRKKVIFHV